MRFGNVFDNHRNVVVPSADGLVVRSCHESPILIHECDRVHGTKMLVVFLCDLTRVHVVLYDADVSASP